MPSASTVITVVIIVVLAAAIWRKIGHDNKPRGPQIIPKPNPHPIDTEEGGGTGINHDEREIK